MLVLAAGVWACTANTDDSASNDVVAAVTDASAPPVTSTVPTDANLKVAFIGDTGTGADFQSVLQLIKREKADLVMVQGDLNYVDGTSPSWFTAIDGEINTSATTIPYVIAKGNHDVKWPGYASGITTRLASWGIPVASGTPASTNYSVVYKGLKIVVVGDSETSPTRASFIEQELASDPHLWKICSWHKNQRASNIGPKNDEMGWAVYEACRSHGAIVAQGHSHTYSRSKTLTNDTNQTVDTTCSDPFSLCVGKGRHFFFDSSVGGQDLRPANTTVASQSYWGTTFTGAFGAFFVEFNVGDPTKAAAYFKTTADVVVDPPESSGKTALSVTVTP